MQTETKYLRNLLRLLCFVLLASSWNLKVQAQDVEHLDDQLEALLLDDLKNELPPDAIKDDTNVSDAGKPVAQDEESLPTGEDIGSESENPLARIGQQMRRAESRLARGETPEETLRLQEKIVTDLAALIKQAQQQKQQSQSQSSKPSPPSRRSQVKQPKPGQKPKAGSGDANSKKPARDSTDRLGNAEAAAAERQELQDRIKDLWGHLPERAREQMLQSTSDKFLPKYEVLIEKYFRRLASDSDEGQE